MVDMNLSGLVIWVVFPYVAVAVFLMGMIWKYDGEPGSGKAHPINSLATISVLIVNLLLFVGLLFTQGIQWVGWYIDFLTFQPNADVMVPSSVIQQVQVSMFFVLLLVLPFSVYMPLVALPFKRMKQIGRFAKRQWELYAS